MAPVSLMPHGTMSRSLAPTWRTRAPAGRQLHALGAAHLVVGGGEHVAGRVDPDALGDRSQRPGVVRRRLAGLPPRDVGYEGAGRR